MSAKKETKRSKEELKRLWTRQLYKEFDDICYFYSIKVPIPNIVVTEVTSYWGQWTPVTKTIYISYDLILNYSWDVVIEIFKHEIAHLVTSELYSNYADPHGDEFKKICDRMGVSNWAKSASADLDTKIPHWKDRTLDGEQERLLKKAEKLLALASSNNEHEALLAMKMVKELYRKYNLAKFHDNAKSDYVYLIINHKKKRIPHHQSLIGAILINHFFVRIVYSSQYDPESDCCHKVMEFMGTSENVRMAEYVYYFLSNNLPILWDNYQRTDKNKKTVKAKRSFYIGVLNGFNERLQEKPQNHFVERSPTPSKAGAMPPAVSQTSALLQKANRKLDCYVNFRYPKLSNRSFSSNFTDNDSYIEGRKQGKKLNIHKGINSQSSESILLLS